MPDYILDNLSKRERQIIEIILKKGHVSAQDIEKELSENITNSTIRTLLRILVQKKVLRIRKESNKYIYFPDFDPGEAKNSSFKSLISTFYSGSKFKAVSSLINDSKEEMTLDELDKLETMIRSAKEGKKC